METVAASGVPAHVPELDDLLQFYGAVVTRRTYLEVLYTLDLTRESMREVRTATLVAPGEQSSLAFMGFDEALELLQLHRQQLAVECRNAHPTST